MKKALLVALVALLILPCAVFGRDARRDISGVYVGEGGTITIKKTNDARLVKVKPAYEDKYNMGFGGEFGVLPEKLKKVKSRFLDTGETMPDAYLVSFAMGANPDCPLKWKNEVGQYDGSYLWHRDIDGNFFGFTVEGDEISLDMPMSQVRALNGNCIASERFTKKR